MQTNIVHKIQTESVRVIKERKRKREKGKPSKDNDQYERNSGEVKVQL